MTKYIGLHIHKCAGTTLQVHLQRKLGLKFRHTNPIVNYRRGLVDIADLPLVAKKQTKVFWGHGIHQSLFYDLDEDVTLFTFLRNPIERVISWHKYEVRQFNSKVSLNDFVVLRSNAMSKMIIDAFPSLIDNSKKSPADKAISVLNQFSFIGRQDNFSVDSSILLNEIGVEPIRSKPLNVNKYEGNLELDLNFIQEHNQEDIKLYNHFFENNEDTVVFKSNKTVNFYNNKIINSIYPRNVNRIKDIYKDYCINNLGGSVRENRVKQILNSLILLAYSADSEEEQNQVFKEIKVISELYGVKYNEAALQYIL